ncbi:hypothetical protein QBC38DRAFT_453229 [Podospora fimiseda]|uniref:Uncharacterized protein n=1 Tax=Podospora fimiseda TaxID=252190 RepID=A0AAN7BU29_9PEZI|nr:hypothetical protein QBC38DRAFT_453229 [Podospora fimiseda]
MDMFSRIPPAGNAVFLAVFAALIPINIFNGIRYKTSVYDLLLTVALLLEVLGHIGRLFLNTDSPNRSYFILYMIGTHWGPILIGSAIYNILPHVTVIYGQQFQLISNGLYFNIIFATLDIFALIFQTTNQALKILLSGFAIQALTLLTFLATYRYFHFKLSHRQYILDARFSNIYLSRRFKHYLIAAQTSIILLLLRIISISALLSQKFSLPNFITPVLDDLHLFSYPDSFDIGSRSRIWNFLDSNIVFGVPR